MYMTLKYLLLFFSSLICYANGLNPQSEHSHEFYVDLNPFLNKPFEEGIKSIGCQPLIIDVPKQTVHDIYAAFNRNINLEKICEITKQWAEEFLFLKEGPWANTNYRFGIFDKGGPTHKKRRLIQGINCKIAKEYCEWVQENHKEELASIPELEFLFCKLMEVEKVCHDILVKKIEEIASDFPNIEKIFYMHKGEKRIPLSIRITRYDHTGNFCLPLHHDISVLSLIFPSDDHPLEECLIIASPIDFNINKLRRPIRPIPADQSQISTILISGALMPQIEVPIAPSPHAVLPHRRDSRYVIVVCCHVPNMCTSSLNTVLDDMQNLPQDFRERWEQ